MEQYNVHSDNWKDYIHLPPNSPSIYGDEPLNQPEPEIVQNPLIERLTLLKRLAEKSDSSSFAVDPNDLAEILLDVGSRFSSGDFRPPERNKDVFEDPLNRGDSLGNVLMISKACPQIPVQIWEEIGEQLSLCGHEILTTMQKSYSSADKWDFVSYQIEEGDDTASESVLAAKERIIQLRKENSRLDRRNLNLFDRLLRAREKLQKQRALLEEQRSLLYQSSLFALANSPDNNPFTTISQCRGKKEVIKEHPRKVVETASGESQLEKLSFD